MSNGSLSLKEISIEKFVAFRQVRDAGNLLTRAGFALPTVDVDEITVRYPSGTI